MPRLQCHYCKRWLPATPKDIAYYAKAEHPVICGGCANESEQYMKENFKGHTFIIRTPEWVCIDKY